MSVKKVSQEITICNDETIVFLVGVSSIDNLQLLLLLHVDSRGANLMNG